MDKSKYDDLSPYNREETEAALKDLKAHPEILKAFATILLDPKTARYKQQIEKSTQEIIAKFAEVHSYDDYQRLITSGYFIPAILKKSVTAFTSHGGEKLDGNESYLYISNHRDIVMDCTLLDYALKDTHNKLCEMAIGDNLTKDKYSEMLFKLNGGIIVKRSLPLREKYLDSIRLSQYFVETICEEKKSIWLAQKSGRAKDGIDQTAPGIVKMLYLSKRKSGISFAQLVHDCRITPVAISYEYDPCDINKGREEVWKQLHPHETYTKKKYEDFLSLIRGIRRFKGRVHIEIGTPLVDKEYPDHLSVAREIDRQIHLNYKLWPTNCFAYDYLEKSDRFRKEYADFDTEKFLAKYAHLSKEVRNFVLNSYANPVRSYLSEL